MASAKVMAKLQADQSSITQMAELHSKQGSNVTNSSLAKKTGLAAQRWHHSVITSQTTHRVNTIENFVNYLYRINPSLFFVYLFLFHIIFFVSKPPSSRDEKGKIGIATSIYQVIKTNLPFTRFIKATPKGSTVPLPSFIPNLFQI